MKNIRTINIVWSSEYKINVIYDLKDNAHYWNENINLQYSTALVNYDGMKLANVFFVANAKRDVSKHVPVVVSTIIVEWPMDAPKSPDAHANGQADADQTLFTVLNVLFFLRHFFKKNWILSSNKLIIWT